MAVRYPVGRYTSRRIPRLEGLIGPFLAGFFVTAEVEELRRVVTEPGTEFGGQLLEHREGARDVVHVLAERLRGAVHVLGRGFVNVGNLIPQFVLGEDVIDIAFLFEFLPGNGRVFGKRQTSTRMFG